MPYKRTYKRTSLNGSSRRSQSRRTGGMPGQRSRSTSRDSRGRSPSVYAQNAKFADASSSSSAILRQAERLARRVGASEISTQTASESIMGTVRQIPKGALRAVLYAVLGTLVLMSAQHIADSEALTQATIAAKDQSCAAKGMGPYNAATQLCKSRNATAFALENSIDAMESMTTGNRGSRDVQIGPANTFAIKRLTAIPEVNVNENDSSEYIAAMNEARRIERDELRPALAEAHEQKSELDAHLRNVQAGERESKHGPLSQRKREIVNDSAKFVDQILPIKNAADKRVVDAQKRYDDAVKMAHAAEAASRK
jgi:hypothetical protein